MEKMAKMSTMGRFVQPPNGFTKMELDVELATR